MTDENKKQIKAKKLAKMLPLLLGLNSIAFMLAGLLFAIAGQSPAVCIALGAWFLVLGAALAKKNASLDAKGNSEEPKE